MEDTQFLLAAYREIMGLIDQNRSVDFIKKYCIYRILALQDLQHALDRQKILNEPEDTQRVEP